MPPSSRRPGYSRRAQYGSFAGYIAGVLGVLAGATLLIVSIVNPAALASARGVADAAAAPAGLASATLRGAGQRLVATLKGYALAGARDARLERELRRATAELARTRAVADENRRLKALLGLATQEPRPVAVTRLIASSASSTRRFATAGAGATSGVAVGMPVRSQLGLIGRVLEVGGVTSRVLLVTDTESLVPVRRAIDGVPAFAQGRGDGMLQLRLINLGVNPIRPGDTFVTSGSGGLYRPGVPLAAATTLTRDGAIARVLSDPAAADYVVIDQVWSQATVPGPEPAPGASAMPSATP